jgi:uracil-DNA glycosylase family 4
MSNAFYFPELKKLKEGEKVKGKQYDCESCGLSHKCENPKLAPYGNPESKIVLLSNYLTEDEDKKGKPFSSKYGQYIRKHVGEAGMFAYRDAQVMNAIACHPTEKISTTFYKCCRPLLKERLEKIKPNLIITFGEHATQSILNTPTIEGIKKMRGRIIPSHEFNCLVFPVFHPDNILRARFDHERVKNDDEVVESQYSIKEVEYTLDKDLERIIRMYKRKYHKRAEVDKLLKSRRILDGISITQIKTIKELKAALTLCYEHGSMAFDYEANCLKPYDKDFKIYATGFGFRKNAWVIYNPQMEKESLAMQYIIGALVNSYLIKIIQNKKFEELVTRHEIDKQRLKIRRDELGNVIRPYEDTMLATHVVDQRRGCTNLDFQNLVRFGILPYNKKVEKYLKKEHKDDKLNRIHLIKPEDLVEYNGLDIITSYANWPVCQLLLEKSDKFSWCYEFLKDGHDSFANMTYNGIPVDEPGLDDLDEELECHQEDIMEKIEVLSDVKTFCKWLEKHNDEKKAAKKSQAKKITKEKGITHLKRSLDLK